MSKPSTAKTYMTSRYAIYNAKGPADRELCIECQKPAWGWVYDHLADDEDQDAHGRWFSFDPDHYEPMCHSCAGRVSYSRCHDCIRRNKR